VDDAVDAMSETVEAMLSRLTTSLSPEDLARQVALTSASIHELFAQSALAQVRQTLIAFLGRIQTAIEQVPTEQVDRAVKGMLERVHQEIQNLGIDQVSTTIRNGFQTAHDFVDHNIDDKLLKGVSDALAAALQQFQNIPIAELGQQLASAIQAAGEVIRNLEQSLASGLHEIETLLASLDGLNFRPVADEVVDEIKALKSKLAAIRPESLSDIEKVAIQGALSILRAIDLTGMIENELKKGFAALVQWTEARVVPDERHAPVSKRVQVFDDALHSAAVVRADVGDVLEAMPTAIVEDDRQLCGNRRDDRRHGLRHDEGKTSHTPAEDRHDARREAVRRVIGVRHDQIVSALPRTRFHAAKNVEEKRVDDVRDHHTERPGLAAGQRPRIQVGGVVELFGRA